MRNLNIPLNFKYVPNSRGSIPVDGQVAVVQVLLLAMVKDRLG